MSAETEDEMKSYLYSEKKKDDEEKMKYKEKLFASNGLCRDKHTKKAFHA